MRLLFRIKSASIVIHSSVKQILHIAKKELYWLCMIIFSLKLTTGILLCTIMSIYSFIFDGKVSAYVFFRIIFSPRASRMEC